ncbi:MAG: hypothetical protein ACT4PL_06445, partial [Phycisphaerales bacterium]
EVTRLEAFNRIRYEGRGGEEKAKEWAENAPVLATAIGCAIQGLGDAVINANLMPLPIVREAMWTRKTRWFVAAAAVAVAAGGVAFVRPIIDQAAVASSPRTAEIDATKRQAKGLKDAWAKVESEAKTDGTASNCQLLLHGREIYADISEDLLALLKAEAEKVTEASKPADKYERVIAKDLRSEYRLYPAAVVVEDPTKPPAPVLAEGEIRPRVAHRLEVIIALPKEDARKILDDVIKAWAAKQNTIPGRAYTVVPDARLPWQLISEQKPEEVKKETIKNGVIQPPEEERARPAPPPARPSSPTRTPGRPPRPGQGPDPMHPDNIPQTQFDNSKPPPGQPGNKPGAGEVDKLAPLGTTPPVVPPGVFQSLFSINWESVIKQPGDAAGAAAKEGGK